MCMISTFCSDSSAENTSTKQDGEHFKYTCYAAGREGKKKKNNSKNKQNQKPQQPKSYSSAITGKNRLSTSVLFPSS